MNGSQSKEVKIQAVRELEDEGVEERKGGGMSADLAVRREVEDKHGVDGGKREKGEGGVKEIKKGGRD